MSSCNEFLGSIGAIISSFISWLIRLITAVGRAPPLEELPIASSPSQPTTALLEAFHAAEHNTRAYPRSHSRDPTEQVAPGLGVEDETSYEEAGLKNVSHYSRSKPHSVSLPSPSAYQAPAFAKSSIRSPLTSLRHSWVVDHNPENAEFKGPRLSQEIDARIGDFGKRRGLKGAPSTFSSSSSRRSSFLSVPRSLSPWSASSPAFLDKPSSPRTPLGAVTKRVRSASTKLARIIVKDISQDLPLMTDQSDPYAMSGYTYFAPDVSAGVIPPTSLYSFAPYCRPSWTQRQTRSLKPECTSQNLQSVAPPHRTSRMKTTIYVMSTADVASARVFVARNSIINAMPASAALASPRILLTVPSVPSIRGSSASPSASDLFEDIDLRLELKNRSEVGRLPAAGPCVLPSPQSQHFAASAMSVLDVKQNEDRFACQRSTLADIGNDVPSTASTTLDCSLQGKPGSKKPSAATDILPAELRDFRGDERSVVIVPGHSKRSSLRPLVLASWNSNVSPRAAVAPKNRPASAAIPTMKHYDYDALDDTFAGPDSAKRSSLRPLVLPTRVASRAAKRTARLSAPGEMISPVNQDRELPLGCRSQELDDIIALLDLFVTGECDKTAAERDEVGPRASHVV